MTGIRYAWFISFALAGCGDAAPTARIESAEPAHTTRSFDPSKTGRIVGQLRWHGPIPTVSEISYTVPKLVGPGFESRTTANPNRPQIDAASSAIAGAVVYLRSFDDASARPWDLPPVSVEIGDSQIAVIQGDYRGRVGFVRRGAAISATSSDPSFQILRGRGDSFFSLTFPKPHEPVLRSFPTNGRVELSSGTGSSWMRADLFVSEHPYFTLSQANGRFEFDRVPAGRVEIVAWLPNWEAGTPIREPESTIIARQTYGPAYERAVVTNVVAGEVVRQDMTLP